MRTFSYEKFWYAKFVRSLSRKFTSPVVWERENGQERQKILLCLPFRAAGVTLITILSVRELYPRPDLNFRTIFRTVYTTFLPIFYPKFHISTNRWLNQNILNPLDTNYNEKSLKVPSPSCARQRVVAPASLRCFRAPVAPDVLLPWRGEADASLLRRNNSAPSWRRREIHDTV